MIEGKVFQRFAARGSAWTGSNGSASPRSAAVPGMNCATCPITVKKALTKVSGVSKTDVNLDSREAKVTFDDAKTNAEALKRASTDIFQRLESLDMQLSEQSIRFRDLVNPIKMVKPLPVP